VSLRAPRLLASFGRAADGAKVAHAVNPPFAALACQRLLKSDVGVEGVVVLERRRLVEHLVRALDDGHSAALPLSTSTGSEPRSRAKRRWDRRCRRFPLVPRCAWW